MNGKQKAIGNAYVAKWKTYETSSKHKNET